MECERYVLIGVSAQSDPLIPHKRANMKDICNLRIQDVRNDCINFLRTKTSETSYVQKPILTVLTEPMMQIMEGQGNLDGALDDYIFPVLKHGLNPRQQLFRIRDHFRLINKYMKEIGNGLKIKEKLLPMLRDIHLPRF